MQIFNMPVQAVLLALGFFLHVLLEKALIQTGHVCYFNVRFEIYFFNPGEAKSVSASGIYVIFPQFVVHWNSNL
jgi:hypothetical protein